MHHKSGVLQQITYIFRGRFAIARFHIKRFGIQVIVEFLVIHIPFWIEILKKPLQYQKQT